MKYKKIQTETGELEIANVVIGSAGKMKDLPENELFHIFDAYIEAGGNIIDTARAYGGGEVEKRIGQYLKTCTDSEKILISTKCCHPASDGRARLSRTEMREDLDRSLLALDRDCIDIYWIHKDDPSVPVESIVDAVNDVLSTGKVRVMGVSNWHTERIAAANAYAEKNGLQGFRLSQVQWSLASTEQKHFDRYTSIIMTEEDYDWYLQNKMTIFAFSPQAQGFFSKSSKDGIANIAPFLQEAYDTPANRERLRRVAEFAKAKEVPVSVPVLAYLQNNRLPCFPIFGATNVDMVNETLKSVDFTMSSEEADALYSI